VNPLDYIFYTFFNLINPVLAIIYAYLGIKILRIPIPVPVTDSEQAPLATKA
jgi:NhaC family Na+:H+ antiporter